MYMFTDGTRELPCEKSQIVTIHKGMVGNFVLNSLANAKSFKKRLSMSTFTGFDSLPSGGPWGGDSQIMERGYLEYVDTRDMSMVKEVCGPRQKLETAHTVDCLSCDQSGVAPFAHRGHILHLGDTDVVTDLTGPSPMTGYHGPRIVGNFSLAVPSMVRPLPSTTLILPHMAWIPLNARVEVFPDMANKMIEVSPLTSHVALFEPLPPYIELSKQVQVLYYNRGRIWAFGPKINGYAYELNNHDWKFDVTRWVHECYPTVTGAFMRSLVWTPRYKVRHVSLVWGVQSEITSTIRHGVLGSNIRYLPTAECSCGNRHQVGIESRTCGRQQVFVTEPYHAMGYYCVGVTPLTRSRDIDLQVIEFIRKCAPILVGRKMFNHRNYLGRPQCRYGFDEDSDISSDGSYEYHLYGQMD